jgi:DNA primase
MSNQETLSNFAQTVKQQADIVKVIGEYVRLKAEARNHVGLCPFDSLKGPCFKGPCFVVHAERRSYYCFRCQETGDVFSFIQKIENVTFPEAVKMVAAKCGISLS